MKFLMLPVILWSPLEQYADVVGKMCPKCIDMGLYSELLTAGWTDGSHSDNGQPRLLHCVNTNVLLISRIYACHHVLQHFITKMYEV